MIKPKVVINIRISKNESKSQQYIADTSQSISCHKYQNIKERKQITTLHFEWFAVIRLS